MRHLTINSITIWVLALIFIANALVLKHLHDRQTRMLRIVEKHIAVTMSLQESISDVFGLCGSIKDVK